MTSRHDWLTLPEQKIAAVDATDGNDRTEKTCARCSLVKITVHPPHGLPWREWRTKDGQTWVGEATPPCLSGNPALAAETTAEVIAR